MFLPLNQIHGNRRRIKTQFRHRFNDKYKKSINIKILKTKNALELFYIRKYLKFTLVNDVYGY